MWKEIRGYEGSYEMNKQGVVRSLHPRNYKKVISVRIDRAGYLSLRLSKDGKTSTYLLHRLVADTFIPNPNNKLLVNHKNGNKLDYRIRNLEWATHSENTKHAYDTGLIIKKSAKYLYPCTNQSIPRRKMNLRPSIRVKESAFFGNVTGTYLSIPEAA